MKANIVFTALICLLSLAMGYFGILWGLKWKNRAEQVTPGGAGSKNDLAGLEAKFNLLQEQLQFQRDENERLNRVIEELQERGAAGGDEAPAFDGPVLENLRAQIEGIRGIRFLEDLAYHLVPREEVAEIARSRLLPLWTERDLEGRRLAYAAMGFIEREIDLGTMTAQLLTGDINAYYDREGRAIFIADDLDARDFNHRLSVASAQVEAMIDQNFKIGVLARAADDSEEASLALESLVQGDMSMVLALLAQRETELGNIEQATSAVANQRDEALSTAPLFLRDLLMFPTLAGGAFCRKLHSLEDGSFKAVNAAYTNPPRNTSELFHEERYLQRIKAPASDPVASPFQISQSLAAVNDREPVWSDVAGELRIRMLFKPTLLPKQASSAGIGWEDDRYWVYELEPEGEGAGPNEPGSNEGSRSAVEPSPLPDASLVWTSTWGSTGDAEEFFAALIAHTQKRYQLSETRAAPGAGQVSLRAGQRRIAIRHLPSRKSVILIDSASEEWMRAFGASALANKLGWEQD